MNNDDKSSEEPPAPPAEPERESLTVWQIVGSALAAGFGVQSSRNRERDFAKGRPGQFIVVGIVLTVLFVVVMVALVNLVLSGTGAS